MDGLEEGKVGKGGREQIPRHSELKGEQERDPFTDLRRGQSIFDKSMNHDVCSFCLFTPI